MEIDNYRLARAVWLDVERTGIPGVYWVSGGERRHFVNVITDECDCADRARGNFCKHLARALLAEGDDAMIRKLRWFIPMPKQLARHRAKAVA